MIRVLLSLLIVVLSSTGLKSETLVARSGEHEGFSRLVFKIPKGTKWELDQDDRTAVLKVEMPDVRFDVEQVFSRIPRTRLLDISPIESGSVLEFELGCDCQVNAFTQAGTLLVIDVKDGPDFQPKQAVKSPPLSQKAYQFHFGKRMEGTANGGFPVIHETRAVAQKAVVPERSSVLNNVTSPVVSGINFSEQRLLEQIGRATQQGLLDLKAPLANKTTQNMPIERPEDPDEMPIEPPSLINLNAVTIIDRHMPALQETNGVQADEVVCLPAELAAVQKWGDDRPFANQIGELRAGLYGEFDATSVDSIAALARGYLYFGFGAEARSVVALSEEVDNRLTVLEALGDLMDGNPVRGHDPFFGQQGCETDVALWAFLSEGQVSEDANTEAILQAFSRLPPHLRVHIGPNASELFSEAGDSNSAQTVLRAINRADPDPNPEYNLAQATAALAEGDTGMALAKMSEVIETGSDQSPKAAIELIETLWQGRKSISPDLPELVGAYALEYRKSDLGADLRRAHVVALALAGRFEDAVHMLAKLGKQDGQEAQRLARMPVLALLTERADDVTFLQIGLSEIKGREGDLDRQTGDALGRRMLDLGFAEVAVRVLEAREDTAPSSDRQIMRARAALAQGLPHRAMIELLNLEGGEIDKLRGEALQQIGENQRAGRLFQTAGEQNAASRNLWLAGQFADTASTRDAHYDRVVQTTQAIIDLEGPAGPQTPLFEARSLIESSLSTRQNISVLMDTVGAGSQSDGETADQ